MASFLLYAEIGMDSSLFESFPRRVLGLIQYVISKYSSFNDYFRMYVNYCKCYTPHSGIRHMSSDVSFTTVKVLLQGASSCVCRIQKNLNSEVQNSVDPPPPRVQHNFVDLNFDC